jgi:GNAT superfamily N-acetyltransferase
MTTPPTAFARPASLHVVSTQPLLRPGSPVDAGPAGTICHDAFKAIAQQHAFAPDFPTPAIAIGLMEHLLARGDVYAVIAEVDGEIVGSNFLWEAGPVAGIGPITVDPRVQNGSIGRRLMQAVMQRAHEQGHAAVRLVQAGYHMRSLSLYAKLGFVVREPLVVLQGRALGIRIDGHAVRPAAEADLGAANALCASVHGHDRSGELLDSIRQGTATVVEHDGRISGYASSLGFFGHAVAETNEDLKALIGAADAFSGPGFMLPARNAAVLRWCLEQGLRMVQPMTLMSVGPYNEPQGAFLPSILY